MKRFPRPGLLLAALVYVLPTLRAETTFQSGPARVALLELYTSEGCSSCPPAEKWLGELRGDPGLWQRFVPVAFHVNYWDHLGWRDALATKAFTQRQYTYSESWGTSSVYTPGFVRDGAEWRWRDDSRVETDAAPAGQLAVTWQDGGPCRVIYTPPAGMKDAFVINVALLGGGIVSNIKAGENSGRELRHEFVALQLAVAPLVRADDGSYSATLTVTPPADRKLPAFSRRALAAWVTKRGKLAPVQAAGGWIGK